MPKFSHIQLIRLCIIIFFVGGCIYYIESQPDCIKMTADGSLKCSCYFKSRSDWNAFKDSTKGLNGDGWEAVATDDDVCKDAAAFKAAFGNTPNISSPHLSADEDSAKIPDTTKWVMADTNKHHLQQKVNTANLTQNNNTNSNNTSSETIHDAQYYFNRAYLESTINVQNSMYDLNKALQIDPKFILCYQLKASLEEKSGDYQNAINDYTFLIHLNPDAIDNYISRGDEENLFKEYNEAIIDYTTALKLNPNYGEVYLKRANAEYNFKDNSDACTDWLEANKKGITQGLEYYNKFCNSK